MLKINLKRLVSLILVAVMLFSFAACKNIPPYGSIPDIPDIENPEKYADFELSREKLEAALDAVLAKIDGKMIPDFGYEKYPAHSSVNNVYSSVNNDNGWNCGFCAFVITDFSHALTQGSQVDNALADAQLVFRYS